MNVDELRSALREPAPVPLTVSLGEVVARGRRRTVARRVAVPVAVLATAAAVAVPAGVLRANPAPQLETAGTHTATTSLPPRNPTAGTPAATAGPPARTSTGPIPAEAYREVIRTGETVAGAERAFRFFPAEAGAGVRFVLGIGYRRPDGTVRVVDGSNEITAPDDSPGFHAVAYTDPGPALPAGDWAVFGYYAGPVARVTAVVDGTPVTARTARWSGYPGITVFWLSPGTGAPKPSSNTAITRVRAFDAGGAALPTGDTQVGVG